MTQKQQYNQMNNLLSAASTSLTLSTMDVDSLLTPLGSSTSPRSANDWTRNMDQRPERNLWRIEEIMEMLNTMHELHALELLNDKTVKSETVFREVELEMNKKGFCKKSHVQIWTKWKFLKSTYTTSKRAGITPKMIAPQVYDILHTMLTNNNALLMSRSQSSLRTDISESGNSLASNNDDSDNSSRIVISGVESNYTMPQKQNRDESEEESGLAHPIFGFRLGGLVKQEPPDNGYDSVQNGIIEPEVQLQSSTTNLRFRTNFKQEAMSPPSNLQGEHSFVNIRNHFTTSGPTTSSTPNVPLFGTTPQTPQSNKNNLPVLRIAPFAKDPTPMPHQGTKDITHELRIASVRTAVTPDLNTSRNAKPSHKPQSTGMETRYGQEKQRNPNTNGTQLRLKHTPLRKTPIPERIMPDSPKHYRDNDSDVDYVPYKYGTNTSHKGKKRLHEDKMEEDYGKKRKRDTMENSWSRMHNDTNDMNDYFDDDDNMSDDMLFNSSSTHNESKSTTKMETLFSNLLKSFQKSLYNLQHEMMNQFVINQMQLVRKEHEFQMKQDTMMMSAMKKQSDEFWANARKFLSTELNNKNHNNHNKPETNEKGCQTNSSDEGKLEKIMYAEKEKITTTNGFNKDKKNNMPTNSGTKDIQNETEQNKENEQVIDIDDDESESDSSDSEEISGDTSSEVYAQEVHNLIEGAHEQMTRVEDGDHLEQAMEQMEEEEEEEEEEQREDGDEDDDDDEELEQDNDYRFNDDTHIRPIGDLLQCALDH